jgi:uncharacterized protein YjiS (DUF1127 family)
MSTTREYPTPQRDDVRAGTVSRMVWRQVELLGRQMRLRRDRRELRGMSDRLLKDIGIARGEIDMLTRFNLNDPTRRLRGPGQSQ